MLSSSRASSPLSSAAPSPSRDIEAVGASASDDSEDERDQRSPTSSTVALPSDDDDSELTEEDSEVEDAEPPQDIPISLKFTLKGAGSESMFENSRDSSMGATPDAQVRHTASR